VALSHASAVREGGGEALIGVVRAGLLSREMACVFGVPTLSCEAEGHVAGGVIASRWGTLRGRRTQARTKVFMRENREIPWLTAGRW
jgi:hypothetical protein